MNPSFPSTRFWIGLLLVGVAACDRSSPPPTTAPAASADRAKQNVPMGELISSAKRQQASSETPSEPAASPTALPAGHPPVGEAPSADTSSLPPGHPPIGNTTATDSSSLPPGHPPMGSMPSADAGSMPPGHPPVQGGAQMPFEMQKPEHMLQLNPPASWKSQPASRFTVGIYTLPKAANDATDAELRISHYPEMKKIPVQQQIDRWVTMFEPPSSQPGAGSNVRQSKLDNAPHPTTVVDISGKYRSGSMGMGMGDGAIKENQRMIAAIVETEDGPWFFKLIGPQATVAEHENEFLAFLRQAK